MRKILFCMLLVCLLTAACTAAWVEGAIPPDEYGKAKHHPFVHEGVKRSYMLYIPKALPEGAPLVFMLHGYADFASGFMQKTGMNAVADAEGFAVAYPQGLDSEDKQFPYNHWNADFTYSDVDDVGYLTALAAHLQQAYGFDPEATFAAGLSNGGFMCYTLALRAPETFRAIASVAGTMSAKAWEDRHAAQAVPVLQVHGKADATIPINGAVFLDGGWGGAPRMDTVLAFWAEQGGAQAVAEETRGNTAIRTYTGGTDGHAVWYYLIKGLGHEWPTEKNSGLHTSALIWSFFAEQLGQ